MFAEFAPIQERVFSLQKNKQYILDVLKEGAKSCSTIADTTMEEVRKALGVLPQL
jgi:hypothetical protein